MSRHSERGHERAAASVEEDRLGPELEVNVAQVVRASERAREIPEERARLVHARRTALEPIAERASRQARDESPLLGGHGHEAIFFPELAPQGALAREAPEGRTGGHRTDHAATAART